MKRLLPIIIVLAILGAVFCCLPRSADKSVEITSLEDLNSLSVGIQTGLSYEVILSEVCPDAEQMFFSDFASMYPALQQGKVDTILTESISYVVEKIEHPSTEALAEPLETVEVCCGVAQNSTGKTVLRELNEFIADCKADGTMDELENRWFKNYDRGNVKIDKSGITGENGVLNVTSEASYEPVCFAGEGGELMGFDVDFIYRFCRAYGYEPNIVPLEYDAMTAALASGKCTVATSLVIDDERAEEILFTDTVMSYGLIAVYDTGASGGESFWDKLSDSFSKTFIRESRWQMFLKGAGTTLLIAFLSALFGTVLGLLIYLWCAHGKKAEQVFTNVLCWLMSSTPTVVMLMVLYYIIFGSFTVSNVAVAVVGFTLSFGCGFYELIVSGVKAVGTGQQEAARAQGFSEDQTFFRIIFPQAAEHFMPAYQGSVIALIQDTSVVGYIAVLDLTKMSDLVRGRTLEAFFPLLATAGIYFLLIWLMTLLIRRISLRLSSKNRKKEKILKGIRQTEGESR